jgi:hypothetical protein
MNKCDEPENDGTVERRYGLQVESAVITSNTGILIFIFKGKSVSSSGEGFTSSESHEVDSTRTLYAIAI